MIRAALLIAALTSPAEAATLAECEALVARVPVAVGAVDEVAGVCLFSDVVFEVADMQWRAERVSLGGDVDALPDALPVRLSGGAIGLVPDPEIPGYPGLEWLVRQQAHPGFGLTFDTTAASGVLRINSFVFRMDEENEIALTARIAGLPEVWPVNPAALSAIQLQALDVEIVLDGMFEALFLMSLGTLLIDAAQPAEPQVAALRERAAAFLSEFEGTGQAENATQVQAFIDALPHPRGVLEIGIGGLDLSASQLLPLATGTLSSDFMARVAEAVALDIHWTADAPMTDFDTLRIGPELAPRSEKERAEFMQSAGLLDRGDCPSGFAGHSATWARDRDLLIGQGAIVELSPDALSARDRLVPRHMDAGTRVALIDMLAVRPEYRETGLEEQIVRALIESFSETIPRPTEAVIYVGSARAPILLSTLRGLDLTDPAFR